jgi:pyridoxal phosphate enzyme (YggS family)
MTIDENIKEILSELEDTKLVCVTKTIDVERINESIRAGATIIGENRVQEFEDKSEDIIPCERHLIGHLQSNKVKKAVQLFDVIESADSLKLLQEIDKRAEDIDKVQQVFLQVNIGNEPQKYGFKINEIRQAIAKMHELPNVHVKGLMCIPPFVSAERTREHFREMKVLFDELKQLNKGNLDIQELSMGMSGDYIIAIEEGATIVRVGSAIFGNRTK